MKRRRGTNRLRLAAIQPNETALIWSPRFGFRQAIPRRTKGEMSLEELFLSVMMARTNDQNYMENVVQSHFAQFTRH